jgi:hypothetical protein
MEYQYRRTEYCSREWDELRRNGFRTLAINLEGIALMRRSLQGYRYGLPDLMARDRTSEDGQEQPEQP